MTDRCYIIARATTTTTSPSDVWISRQLPSMVEVVPNRYPGVAIARAGKLALVGWLVAAIDATLDGAPVEPRPSGMLIERGAFEAVAGAVWARSWYGDGQRCLVARCSDATEAHTLADALNMLLAAR